MAATGEFSVRFWGVRGSVACPGPQFHRYGGNTSCVELRCGEHLLIFDGGTGLRPLGQHLKGNSALEADLFFSHSHIDHIVGLPFFAAMFEPANRMRMWAGHLKPERDLRSVLCMMMAEPLFPVPVDIFTCRVEYKDFTAGETLNPQPGVALRTARLNHPNGATGYRVEYGGKSLCYVTDTEHVAGQPDRTVLDLIRGADVFIYDATYTDAEFPRYLGWGHSTWEEGVRLADAGGVKTLVLFHHDPSHDDEFMDEVQRQAEARRPGTLVAREGMTLVP